MYVIITGFSYCSVSSVRDSWGGCIFDVCEREDSVFVWRHFSKLLSILNNPRDSVHLLLSCFPFRCAARCSHTKKKKLSQGYESTPLNHLLLSSKSTLETAACPNFFFVWTLLLCSCLNFFPPNRTSGGVFLQLQSLFYFYYLFTGALSDSMLWPPMIPSWPFTISSTLSCWNKERLKVFDIRPQEEMRLCGLCSEVFVDCFLSRQH